MIRGLLVKEWKDHGFSMAIIVLLLLSLVVLMSRVPEFSENGGSAFAILGYVLAFGGPLVTLTLATMLIHSEYRSRTCYFLAALPIHRGTILFVKYFVGLGGKWFGDEFVGSETTLVVLYIYCVQFCECKNRLYSFANIF